MSVAVVGWPQQTNRELVAAWRSLGLDVLLLTPDEALARLQPGDVAIGRLDVVPTLDGIEPGLEALGTLTERGVRLLNSPEALVWAPTTSSPRKQRSPMPVFPGRAPGRSGLLRRRSTSSLHS